MSTWLVTGGAGFLGRPLLAALETAARAGTRIVALDRRPPVDWPLDEFGRVDLEDVRALEAQLARFDPDVVFHLAGLTAARDPTWFYQANVGGTVRLIEAWKRLGRSGRLVLAGSAAELGPVPVEHLPAGESCPCRPVGAYGLSKWFATAYALRCGPPIEVVVARIFNPIGPGLPSSQAFGQYAARLAESVADPVRLVVGDLDARRDFVDVRDVATALVALAVRGHAGLIYHVGSGHSRSVREGLDRLVELSGRRVELVHQIGYRRGPADSCADITRISDHTGWSPRIGWEQCVADLWQAAKSQAPVRQVA